MVILYASAGGKVSSKFLQAHKKKLTFVLLSRFASGGKLFQPIRLRLEDTFLHCCGLKRKMSDNAKRIVCGIEGRKTMLLSQKKGTDQINIYTIDFSALENLPEVNRSIIHQPEPSQQVSASSSGMS